MISTTSAANRSTWLAAELCKRKKSWIWISQDQDLNSRVGTAPRRRRGRVGYRCRTRDRDWHDRVDCDLIGLRVGDGSGVIRCDDLGGCVVQQLDFVEHVGLVHNMHE